MGKVLDDMSEDELQRWETRVRKCVLDHANNIELRAGVGCSLRFESLVNFPPNRQNLIVAVFKPSSSLDDLYQKLCDLARAQCTQNSATKYKT